MKLNLKDYVHPSLKIEVPKEIRKQVYEIAISEKLDLSVYGLCLSLPMILWDLKSFIQKTPSNEFWDYAHTPIAFPELNKERIRYINNSLLSIRMSSIEVLNEMLKEVQ